MLRRGAPGPYAASSAVRFMPPSGADLWSAVKWAESLEQLGQQLDRLARIDDRDRPLDPGSAILALVVDLQERADRGQEVGDANRAFYDFRSVAVGTADHLSALDSAAGQHRAPGAGPVITAAAAGD